MQPTYATLINELVQEYRTRLANLRYATAIVPELRQWLTEVNLVAMLKDAIANS